ncbi:hypothetical protein PG994_010294 [Apiospora phragmitis]|uniref:Uncharacterized protein n=1 Tax=Apiospora phragmitis TaxID=2905665 RepID=A0ABR1TPL8_9PEZI
MATAEVANTCGSWTRSAYGSPPTLPSTTSTLWDDLDVQVRLNLIARAWQISQKNATNVALREQNNPSSLLRQQVISKPLIVPNASPKRSRLSAQCDTPGPIDDTLHDPSRTDQGACQRAPTPEDAPAPSNPETTRRRSREDLIFRDPSMDVQVDFSSEEGFSQFAKKKKKAAPTTFNWGAELGKDGDGPNGDDGNGGDQNGGGGDTGAGGGGDAGGGGSGGGDDDKDKDEDKKDEPEDPWGAFEAAGAKKKKGKKGTEPEPAPEAFDEVNLNDPGEGKKEAKSGVFASWGSSWVTGSGDTGGSTWFGSGTKAAEPPPKEEKKGGGSMEHQST